ncbi:hypothetical protein [Arthrobacter sp. SPG23]|uniref:hypothetical protein n=1 Tax=Arthrobacter sp. SPG23 TaxID=1610703 RepID=UPI0006985EBE|nr:hypothetical protein [Arthrobacter sp. SPG23]
METTFLKSCYVPNGEHNVEHWGLLPSMSDIPVDPKTSTRTGVVGYSSESGMKASLAVSALPHASALRIPRLEVPFHSNAFVRTSKGTGLKESMQRIDACADNVTVESFFSLLQNNALES